MQNKINWNKSYTMDFVNVIDESLGYKVSTDVINLIDKIANTKIKCVKCSNHTEIMYEITDESDIFDICYDCIEDYFFVILHEDECSIITDMYMSPRLNFYYDTDMEEIGDTLLVYYTGIY